MRFMNSEFLRFVVSGGVNTLVGYGVYLWLHQSTNYSTAYTLTYLFGIAFSYYLNSRFVFHQPLHWKKAIQYPVVYIVASAAFNCFCSDPGAPRSLCFCAISLLGKRECPHDHHTAFCLTDRRGCQCLLGAPWNERDPQQFIYGNI